MKHKRVIMAFIVAYVYAASISLGHNVALAAPPPTITTTEPVYTIWHVGGTLGVSVTNVRLNYTYYVWLQKPGATASEPLGLTVRTDNGSSSVQLHILPTDPAGTYVLSLSEQRTTNAMVASTHFGVFGTDTSSYERTQTITIAGGGFKPNATLRLNAANGNQSLPGFPLTMRLNTKGEFSYALRLDASAPTGTLNISASGVAFAGNATISPNRQVDVKTTPITIHPQGTVTAKIERTSTVSTNYRLTYADGSGVTIGNYTSYVLQQQKQIESISLTLANSTSGLWTAKWVPSRSQNLTAYSFLLNPSNLTDPYGNPGQGQPILSTEFSVIPAILEVTPSIQTIIQRTQNITVQLTARYHDGSLAQNFTQLEGTVTQSDGAEFPLNLTAVGTTIVGAHMLSANATLGQWKVNFYVKDLYGNAGSAMSSFNVTLPTLNFNVDSPNSTQRTTFFNITTTVTYPDRVPFTSGVTLEVQFGNNTWIPAFNVNSTTGIWKGTLYISQNATLGAYNITLTARDKYGNDGNYTTKTEVIPARFLIIPNATNSTVQALTQVDLPVLVAYPNGTILNFLFGHVNAVYTNSTGEPINTPLAYNSTEGRWHMYFSAPEQGDFNFTFTANDVFGNTGLAPGAYLLKVNPSQRVLTQRLIIAGVIGALVPVALLIWAIATISTRRRKHRP